MKLKKGLKPYVDQLAILIDKNTYLTDEQWTAQRSLIVDELVTICANLDYLLTGE